MFQMRLPKSISGEVKRPLRVGLGVIPKPQARKIADRLAVIAREEFERIEIAMSKTNDDENGFWPLMEDMLGGDLDGLDEDAKGKRAWQAVTMTSSRRSTTSAILLLRQQPKRKEISQ